MTIHPLIRVLTLFTCAAAFAAGTPTILAATSQRDVPEGYQQILPRGGIPAIDDPVYVPASAARVRWRV